MNLHSAPEASTAGLLLSLSNSLPPGARTLQRRAKAIAARLVRPHDRALDRRAADLLSALLTATDCAEAAGYEVDGLLDPDFDAAEN